MVGIGSANALKVPPIVIRVLRTQEICKKYDLSSVRFLFTGAAPMGEETIQDLKKLYPKWKVGQGYGLQIRLTGLWANTC